MTARLAVSQPTSTPPSKFLNDGNSRQCHNSEKNVLGATRTEKRKSVKCEPAGKTHGAVIGINTGWGIDPDIWTDQLRAREILDRETNDLADALARSGVVVRKPSELTAIGAVTGRTEVIAAFRAVRFLPAVAARDRRPLLNGLQYFTEHHPSSAYFRFMVFTSAEPVPAGGPLRASMQKLARKLSKWASRVEKKYAVEVLFRGTEFTRLTAAERRMDDQYPPDTILYHVHANVVAWPRKAMSPIEWKEFLSSTWSKTKAHWRDNGKLQKPSEVIKYVIKPNCLQGASDKEIHWLYEQTQRLKISQPMGSFATFLAGLELAHQKIARVNGPEQGALVKVQKATRLNHSSQEDTDEAEAMVKPKSTCSRPPTNILLGMTLPCRRFSPWSEPLILVQRYEPKATSAGDIKRLSEIDADMQWARIKWDENDAPPPALALEIAARCRAGLSFDICEHVATSKPAAVADDYRVHTSRPTVPNHLVIKTTKGPFNIHTLSTGAAAAYAIASQSRRVVGATKFISAQIASLQRDFVRFGGDPPPSIADIARWLRQPEVHSRPSSNPALDHLALVPAFLALHGFRPCDGATDLPKALWLGPAAGRSFIVREGGMDGAKRFNDGNSPATGEKISPLGENFAGP